MKATGCLIKYGTRIASKVIGNGAFDKSDGLKIPVSSDFASLHKPEDSIGYAILHSREDGIYYEFYPNKTPKSLEIFNSLDKEKDTLGLFSNRLITDNSHNTVISGNIIAAAIMTKYEGCGSWIETIEKDEESKKLSYREMAVEILKIAGQDLIDRADEIIPYAEMATNIDVVMHIPTLTDDPDVIPTIKIIGDFFVHRISQEKNKNLIKKT